MSSYTEWKASDEGRAVFARERWKREVRNREALRGVIGWDDEGNHVMRSPGHARVEASEGWHALLHARWQRRRSLAL